MEPHTNYIGVSEAMSLISDTHQIKKEKNRNKEKKEKYKSALVNCSLRFCWRRLITPSKWPSIVTWLDKVTFIAFNHSQFSFNIVPFIMNYGQFAVLHVAAIYITISLSLFPYAFFGDVGDLIVSLSSSSSEDPFNRFRRVISGELRLVVDSFSPNHLFKSCFDPNIQQKQSHVCST